MNYRVVMDVKSRLTASMYETITNSNVAGFEFASMIEKTVIERIPLNDGIDYTVTWVQMPDGYWIPLKYKGIEYVKAIVETPPIKNEFVSATLTRADGTTVEFVLKE